MYPNSRIKHFKDASALILFVSICSVHHARLSLSTRFGIDINTIKYATKHITKMKAKFSYCDQIKFMNLYLNQEYLNSSISLTSVPLTINFFQLKKL